MTKAKVYIANKQKIIKIPTGARLLIKRCCNAVLNYEKFELPAEISISLVDDKHIQELNAAYRDKDSATDVLSFPMGEMGNYDINEETGAAIMGDIVISMERAVDQARLYGHSLERELGFLTVHSMFHLLGYDHETDGISARVMKEKQEAVLQGLGLSRDETFITEREEYR